jgi:uncharacterized RmlC-like cupin family protein
MRRIEVARKAGLRPGQTTPGGVREEAFEADGVLISRSTVAGAVVSDWHHHGTRDLHGFISGRLRLGFGRRGEDGVDLDPGGFIPPRLIHGDVDLSKRRELQVATVLLGKGPHQVNVDGPS